ncbi:MAG: transposase [Candidatus Poribacteria bacterium]|nr:transposase [Candidatus Poribacteria bacterium]
MSLPDELADTWKGGHQKNNTNKAAVKLQLRFDVATGTFKYFQLTDGVTQDCTAKKQMPILTPGSLRLADHGYFSLDTLGKLSDAGVFWITQLKVDCSLFDDAAPFVY